MKLRQFTLALAVAATVIVPGGAQASSHREAPFVTEHPKVDATDFYMFRSYEPGRDGYVTLIANYIPLQDPYGGPNYFTMDPEALYEIHVDNNGDAREDLTFQFRFNNTLKDISLPVGGKNISIPLINVGAISAGNTANLNVTESYNVTLVRGNRRGGQRSAITNAVTNSSSFTKPVDNIGTKSIPDYPAYAASHIYNIKIPGCRDGRMFVGQRKDPFVVNLGEIFDLVNTNPLGAVNAELDLLDDANVTSLMLEVPKDCVAPSDPVVGAWTTASLRQARLLRPVPSFDRPTLEGGAWVQVSRLAMPLVNEVVIGLKDKDKFNASRPQNDGNAGQFGDYVTNPTLPLLLETLFGRNDAAAPTLFPRADLVGVFLTGINTQATGNLNQPQNVVAAEMMRLNTSIPATAKGVQKNLGVIGGDLAGFPNGRRPGDDVVDVALRVVMGQLISLGLYGTPAQAPTGNSAYTDGALVDDSFFDASFPYLRTPLPGSPSN